MNDEGDEKRFHEDGHWRLANRHRGGIEFTFSLTSIRCMACFAPVHFFKYRYDYREKLCSNT